jgi:uncharacterized damage-inducible protein DinB
MTVPASVRRQVADLLDWSDAHASFDAAVEGLPAPLRGSRPEGLPHSPWELVEHLRIAQRDILDFCRAATYHERRWPEEYWPPSAGPPSAGAWEESISGIRADRAALRQLALDPAIDLLGAVPNGTGQSYLRELLLVADHTAYHVGQLVLVRRLLGAWPAG